MPEFFIPANITDLEKSSDANNCYTVEEGCEFNVPVRQQLDDVTRLFDALHHEKSPTAIFTKPELFSPLYTYVKAVWDRSGNSNVVSRLARHKISHETGERLKRLSQVSLAFLRKRKPGDSANEALEVCLRSTIKMYVFITCNLLLSVAPLEEENSTVSSSQKLNRKRVRQDACSGFGDDGSGIDMDGRELVLSAFVELCSPEVMELWPEKVLEDTTLNLLLRVCLHMVTLQQNIGGDAQAIAGALSLLFGRVSGCILSKRTSVDASDLVAPLVELSLKAESTALFLSRLVSDIEQNDQGSAFGDAIMNAIFENMVHAALHEVSTDGTAAKNLASFFSEIARRSVSIMVKMATLVIPALQSENYDIRKAIITCIAEMVIQRYTGPVRNANDDTIRGSYLNEMLFRVMDINAFVRNHTLHSWGRLVESRAVPKRYYLALMEALVGRLEDRNYLVRDAAMTVISSVLRKNWFGNVLSLQLIEERLASAKKECENVFSDLTTLEVEVGKARAQLQPMTESLEDPLVNEVGSVGTADERTSASELTDLQSAAISKVIFYQNTLSFVRLTQSSLEYACILLDSKTERDVIESIKLIVACCESRVDGAELAFLKVLVMVFEGELRIQLAVRDAFVEVIFTAFSRVSATAGARTAASAQKLINILRGASEGEVSAVDRIFALLKLNPAFVRLLSDQFIEVMWGIAEGSLDAQATDDDRRTAMRIYSLLSKYVWKDLRVRKESIIEFLSSESSMDNVILSYVFCALKNEALDPHFQPIAADEDVGEHNVLRHIVRHLCRRTTAIASWMILAESAIDTIHSLCEVPVALYSYILEYYGNSLKTDPNVVQRSQFFFLLGRTALKQLVAIEAAEKAQLKSLEEPTKHQTEQGAAGPPADSMHKELGLGSHEFRRHKIQELAQKRKQAILSAGSVWSGFMDVVVSSCRQKATVFAKFPFERICAVLALCQYMIVSDEFCSKHLNLLFTIVADKRELWATKVNIVVALGDLACVHPNLLGPYLNVPTTGFFKLLVDTDVRVRAVTIQVCSHLVLGEMLRIRDHLYTIVKLVADHDETIASNAVTFVQNLAMKEKEKTGNLIPPLVTQLSNTMPEDKFQLAMRTLLERVEGDKPTDSLIDRLCQRFETFSERSKKKLVTAQNIAFCLSELNFSTERAVKRITSESCYQQYRHWLRCPEVFDFFKIIATKAKKQGRGAGERRDKTAIEEWEARMLVDSRTDARESEGTDTPIAGER